MLWDVVLWEEGKSPKLQACGLAPPLEENRVVCLFEEGDGSVIKEAKAAMVTQFTFSEECVLEGRHDLAFAHR